MTEPRKTQCQVNYGGKWGCTLDFGHAGPHNVTSGGLRSRAKPEPLICAPAPAPAPAAKVPGRGKKPAAAAVWEGGCRRDRSCVLPNGHVAPCKLGDVSSETYTMEAIVDERDAGGGVSEYRVKWEGWPEADATWEPHSKVAGTLLDAWHAPGARTAMTWTAEEDAALRAAVAKHGTGRWTEAAAEPGLGRRNNEQLRGRCARLAPPPPTPPPPPPRPRPVGPSRLSHAAPPLPQVEPAAACRRPRRRRGRRARARA